MPELPEVEAVRQVLARQIVGATIAAVEVREPRLRWPLAVRPFTEALTAARIVRLRRRAKYLLVDLDRGGRGPLCLAVHLGMTGWWGVREGALWPHDHVIFALVGGRRLAFNDARRFGSLHCFVAADEARHPLLVHLGPEPLDPAAFTAEHLFVACRGRKTTIKERLMDARVVVGVGNIYAAEALYAASIHPRLPAGQMTRPKCLRLTAAVRQVLTDAIAFGGTSFRDFRGSDGRRGRFVERLNVYGRAEQPCLRCARPLHSARLGGRATCYCVACQRR